MMTVVSEEQCANVESLITLILGGITMDLKCTTSSVLDFAGNTLKSINLESEDCNQRRCF